MSEVFLKIINMSIAASWMIPVILLVRICFKRAPKWVRVLLWGFVAVRMICPFSFESVLSLIPSTETVSPQIMMDPTPQVTTGLISLNAVLNPIIAESFAPNPATSANPLQILIPVAAIFWITGMVVMLLYAMVSYCLLHRKVVTAVRLDDTVLQSENIDSPFVLGIVNPKIYLPFRMNGEDLAYVIAHEQAHIQRKDHLWKPLGFLLLTIHWFNPLMWLAYILLCRDIELACDEKVIQKMDHNTRADYSQVLVNCSVNHRRVSACPLAFGEVGIKKRVKSVLQYKKPAVGVILCAIIVCVFVAVCFLTNPTTGVNENLSVFVDCQIANHFQTDKTAGNASCVNWKVLGTEKRGKETTLYMWVLYEEYSMQNNELQIETGAHMPTVITAKRENGAYTLVEYWEPRDGSYFEQDIREKFPWHLQNRALDSQRYVKVQKGENEDMAREYFRSMSVIGGADGPTSILVANNGGIFSSGTKAGTLSLDAVIRLSQKGRELRWSDFSPYHYVSTGSGLYIRVYEIDELFELWIGGSDPDSEPMYIYLALADDLDTKIDIRDGGVEEFIAAHRK